jgi:hypothetical protein
VIGRFVVGTSTAFEDISGGYLGYATGIAAVGDTTLYVGCYDGLVRSVNATDTTPTFEHLDNTLMDPYYGGTWQLRMTAGTNGCPDSQVLWTIGYGDDCGCIFFYEDALAAPVVLASPADDAKISGIESVTLNWNELCGATTYEVWVGYICAGCPELTTLYSDCIEDLCLTLESVEEATEYFWKVRVCAGSPALSKWSVEQSFTTALKAVSSAMSPLGTSVVVNPAFSWTANPFATGYEIEVATDANFTNLVITGESPVNAWAITTDLEYGTTYYWRVRSVADGIKSGWTSFGFTTVAEPEPPIVIPPQPTPTIIVPTPQVIVPEQAVPVYVWAIIGIGAVLVIAVIVLIVRTRRVP